MSTHLEGRDEGLVHQGPKQGRGRLAAGKSKGRGRQAASKKGARSSEWLGIEPKGSGATEKARRGHVALQRFSTEAKTAVAIGLGASSPNNHNANGSGSTALMQTCFFKGRGRA